MAQIKVKNFGPVNEGLLQNDGFINIKPLTVFCGKQSTGKSTVAKLISSFFWLEKRAVKFDGKININNQNDFRNFLENQKIGSYLKDNSEIVYRGDAYCFYFKDNKFTKRRINRNNSYLCPKIMYIPAERNVLTALDNASKIDSLPVILRLFFEEYINAQQKLIKGGYILPFGNCKVRFDAKSNYTSLLLDGDQQISISEASSGIQSYFPLSIVTESLAKSVSESVYERYRKLSFEDKKIIRNKISFLYKDRPDEIQSITDALDAVVDSIPARKFKQRTEIEIILKEYIPSCLINIAEEPELNLFPESQKLILDTLLKPITENTNSKLIITTHSPYIISDLILRAKLDALKKKGLKDSALEKKIGVSVSSEDMIVYETTNDGIIREIKQEFGLPSDDNPLNNELQESNNRFGDLLEQEDLLDRVD